MINVEIRILTTRQGERSYFHFDFIDIIQQAKAARGHRPNLISVSSWYTTLRLDDQPELSMIR